MWFLPWRIRPPTENEHLVLFWGIFAIVIGFGAVCLFFGYRIFFCDKRSRPPGTDPDAYARGDLSDDPAGPQGERHRLEEGRSSHGWTPKDL